MSRCPCTTNLVAVSIMRIWISTRSGDDTEHIDNTLRAYRRLDVIAVELRLTRARHTRSRRRLSVVVPHGIRVAKRRRGSSRLNRWRVRQQVRLEVGCAMTIVIFRLVVVDIVLIIVNTFVIIIRNRNIVAVVFIITVITIIAIITIIKTNHGLLQSTSTMILFCRGVTTPQRVAINGATG